MPAQNQTSEISPPLRPPSWAHVVFFGRDWRFTLVRLAILVAACFLVFRFILLPVRVEGISMLPTCQNGSVNFVNRLAYVWHPPRRGDVVGIRLADFDIKRSSIMYLKRIIGLPGETVAFVNGKVLINGRPLDEPYEKKTCDWNVPPVKLAPDQYFVVGDNRSMPPQYHEYGGAWRDQIIGKLLL